MGELTTNEQFVVRSTLTRIEGQHRHSTDEGKCWLVGVEAGRDGGDRSIY